MLLLFTILFALGVQAQTEYVVTIDDGPNAWTQKIAERLVQYQIPAVFFVTESHHRFKEYHSLWAYLIGNGFVIGNHTRSHNYEIVKKASYLDLYKDVAYVSTWFMDNYKYKIRYFRSPYGVTNNTLSVIVFQLGMKEVWWTAALGTLEWGPFTEKNVVDHIVNSAMPSIRGQTIILLHSTKVVYDRIPMLYKALYGGTFAKYKD